MRRIALTLLTAISLLVILSASQMVLAWESLDSLAPPDNKYYVWDNFDTNIESSRFTLRQGACNIVGYSTSAEAWCELRPYQASVAFYYSTTSWVHPWKSYMAMTAKLYSTHNMNPDGDWFAWLDLDRGGIHFSFGFSFHPTCDNYHYLAGVSMNGVFYPGWYTEAYCGPGTVVWHYYRVIAGYKQVNGVWRSWVWFYLGNMEGTWWYTWEKDLTDYGFGSYNSGTGVADYPMTISFGWDNVSGKSVTVPYMGVDFIAKKLDGENPHPPGWG